MGDPFDQDDWAAWGKMTASIGEPTQVVGDDLTVTNVTRVKKAIDDKSCNALLLKVNQIGSITESIDAVKMCVSAPPGGCLLATAASTFVLAAWFARARESRGVRPPEECGPLYRSSADVRVSRQDRLL